MTLRALSAMPGFFAAGVALYGVTFPQTQPTVDASCTSPRSYLTLTPHV